uniref:Uncharacterized protein n=1 Tax=Physcomitrium patens TaxID=3218 RepID=A0A2K1KWC9_PHYPA|nr:hypothetical protein PHYPA_005073 [Physcomitrium patens]
MKGVLKVTKSISKTSFHQNASLSNGKLFPRVQHPSNKLVPSSMESQHPPPFSFPFLSWNLPTKPNQTSQDTQVSPTPTWLLMHLYHVSTTHSRDLRENC